MYHAKQLSAAQQLLKMAEKVVQKLNLTQSHRQTL